MRRRRLGGGSSTTNSLICIPGTIGEGFCALPGKSHGDERERFGAAMEERRSLEAQASWLRVARRQRLQACGNVVSAEGPQLLTPPICIPGTIGEGFCASPGKSHGEEGERFGAAMEERRRLRMGQ
uniref:Uncharacterized protein n=1 Tax=Fagus sylvatica TaxID=28930 RepID=A0A2N9IFC6_FAGSY